MKKIFLATIALVTVNLMNAQITILDGDGAVIEDGSVFVFNSVDPNGMVENPVAKLSYYIQNNTSSEIGVKAAMVEIIGSDGSNVQFCMEMCLFDVTETSVVPAAAGPGFSIDAGATTGPGIYFWNFNDESNYISYTFKVYQADPSSGGQVGDAIHITYVYDANASVSDVNLDKLGVQINNTLVSNEFSFTTTSDMTMELFDPNGRSVASESFNEGTNLYNALGLNAGIYIAKFTDRQGQTASVKIVKQ